MHPNILVPRELNKIGIEGKCRGYQTELDFIEKSGIVVSIDTGKKVPYTEWESKNTIADALLYYLAYKVGTDTNNKALDALFTGNGTKASVGAAQAGKDGIVHGLYAVVSVDYILQTILNVGGTEAEAYLEFYGYITGAATLDDYLSIGHNYSNAGDGSLTTYFSNVSIDQAVAANRRYHHYWKFTFAEA